MPDVGLSERRDPLLPYQYEMVFALTQERLTASELGMSTTRWRWTAQETASRLRPLVQRGWITRDESGIYEATERAIEAVSW